MLTIASRFRFRFRTSVALNIVALGALFAALYTTCYALRMIEFDAPDSAFQGDTIHLSCLFTLQNGHQQTLDPAQSRFTSKKFKSNLSIISNNSIDSVNLHEKLDENGESSTRELSNVVEQLYAVKWYKDEREFFRYLAQDWPRKQALPAEGLFIDLDKSDNYTVVLRNVSLKTSGQFRCEVSTDAPIFVTKSIERKMLIYSLPNEGPAIEILKQSGTNQQRGRYFLNEQVELKCSTPESKPAATLDWIINDFLNLSAPIDSHLKQIFTIRSSRFVRIPSVNRSNSTNIFQGVGRTLAKTILGQPIVSFDTYELHGDNATLIEPGSEKEATLVKLASSSLDQLLETSVSKLNFTVDVNFLQLLSYLNRLSKEEENQTYRTRVGQINRDGPSLKRYPITESLLVLLNSTSSDKMIPNQLSTNAISRGKRSKLAAGSSSIYLSNSLLSPSLPQAIVHTSKIRSSRGSFITGAKRPKKIGVSSMNDSYISQIQLRIKCVSRLLQVTMSHQTKLHLVNRTRDNEGELTLTNPLRRQRTSGKNSASTFRLSNFKTIFIIVAYLFTKIWKVSY